ncbi:hypothetical protein GIB67_002718 [Kingdonia uniflora]|uniref:Uncharacterized protein n=1 Tax=Kingdonia uniflora TaxID=39325 RepID=A0A7J7LK07_9MAGN|nr:hypothetical protein GIB67_002718 [Kingdonia uniflora]
MLSVKNICIRDPNATEESTKATKVEMGISGKLHALVEYETVKEAEKAVATLNDENNWRSGLRVEPLLKRMGKYGLGKRSWKGNAPEKNNNGRTTDSSGDKKDAKSNDHTDEIPEQEEAAHSPSEKIERRGRNQGRSRGHKHQNMNGHGHGYVSSVLGSEGINRAPPPGPRMPDGTRGFAIGRGQPPLSNHT